MQTINVRNVHDDLLRGIDLLSIGNIVESRNGAVYEASTPITTVYLKPTERVLFWPERNANPFFHFMEGLWMLEGRKDLGFVQTYNKRMVEYSDDGSTIHGAYGWRWRHHFDFDQIGIIINTLEKDPHDRRCVLQMWDPTVDLDKPDGKDVPCNTCIYFKIDHEGCLQMTVSNRSNDIIWGAYGANAVHLSMLQEYVATCVGVPVGIYYQVSDSYHAYKEIYEELLEKFLARDALDFYAQRTLKEFNPYTREEVAPYPMINTDLEKWTLDCSAFMRRHPFDTHRWDNSFHDDFFNKVAVPIQDTWWLHKTGKAEEAMVEIQGCAASDWRKACWEWLARINDKEIS